MFGYPEIVLLYIGSVDDQQIVIRLELLVNQKIIDSTSIRIEHHSVEDLAGSHGANVVSEYVVHEFFGIRTAYEYLAHMGDIEHSNLVADC